MDHLNVIFEHICCCCTCIFICLWMWVFSRVLKRKIPSKVLQRLKRRVFHQMMIPTTTMPLPSHRIAYQQNKSCQVQVFHQRVIPSQMTACLILRVKVLQTTITRLVSIVGHDLVNTPTVSTANMERCISNHNRSTVTVLMCNPNVIYHQMVCTVVCYLLHCICFCIL